MATKRLGDPRGTGRSRTRGGAVDALVNAVADIVYRPAQAAQESRLPPRQGPRIGGVNLEVRAAGEAYTDFARQAFTSAPMTTDQLQQRLDDIVGRRLAAIGGAMPEAERLPDVRTEAPAFARRLEWELQIPGEHRPSGLSNQELLGIRQSEGRDFAADTSELRAHVLAAVREGLSRWDDDSAAQIASRAILEWILRRVDEGGVDVDLAPLDPAYRAWKSAHGLDTRIGIATGAWRRALARAEVIVTA